jgi:GNAT superfamily N-acetyltransferase
MPDSPAKSAIESASSPSHTQRVDAAKAVQQISLGHGPRAIATLTLAFSGDPAARWSWPDPDVFLESFPAFALALGGAAFAAGGAYADEDFCGVALWLPPGAEADDPALQRLFTRSLPAGRLAAAFDLFGRMGELHPKQAHWHLPLIGVDPVAQGQKLGERLLRPALAQCDAEGVLAYLESSNLRNVPFYERLGFRAQSTLQVGDSPIITPMLREPSRAR